jgi:CBS domain containing-hemolysin-like protein
MDTDLIITLLVLFLILDLILTVVRSSMVNAHLPRLLNLRPVHEKAVDDTIRRIERQRIRVSLRLAHLLLLFLFVLFLFYAMESYGWLNAFEPLRLLYAAGLLIVAAFVLFSLESWVDGFVLKAPEVWALRTSIFASMIDKVLSPVSGIAIRLMGQSENSLGQITAPTDDELKTWVQQGQTDGALEKEEREMIYSIFQFGDTLAREIMVPRIDIRALAVDTTVDEALVAFVESGHSRIPIFEETVDNIIGLLYAKDLLRHQSNKKQIADLRTVLRPAYFVPEAKKLDELLTEMQTKRVHMAIVVDEYGGVAGLVTLEDLLEEIIGEIQDEYDQSEELPFQKINDNEYLFKGSIDLDDFNEVMGTELSKDMADTLGGFMYGEVGKVPSGGERVLVDNVELIVENVTGRRIRKVRAHRLNILDTELETTDVDSSSEG